MVIVSVCGEREKRQSWRNGLWGRELLLDNAKKQDMASVSGLLESALSRKDSQHGYEYPQTGRSDGIQNEVQDSPMSLPKVIRQKQTKFDFLGFPKQRQVQE